MSRPLHLVVVDDDPTIVKLLSVTLRAALGNEVTTFNSGAALLEAWPTLRPVDVVLSDFTMPDCSGTELAARLKKHSPHLAFILLTAVDVLAIDSALEDNPDIDAVLVKPCPVRTVVATIDAVFARRTGPAAVPSTAGQPDPLVELQARYRKHLLEERVRLEPMLSAATTLEGARALRDALHQLAGTSGTYGMTEVMQSALEVRSLMARGASVAVSGQALLRRLEQAGSGG